MPQKISKSTAKKTVVIKMRRTHRILVLTLFSLLFLSMLAAMIYLIASSEYGFEIILMLLSIPVILFLPCPLYYATWQITFDADGIQKQLFGIKCKKHLWAQIKEARSAWLISERSYGISIQFKDGQSVRFRMDCENAEAAKKLILSHCSIKEH